MWNRRTLFCALLFAAGGIAACAPTYVVVPERRDGYGARDTLYGRLKGKDVRVTFRHDTGSHVDTVTRWRTVYRDGARVDTVLVERVGGRRPGQWVDTVRVVDTVRIGPNGRRQPPPRVDTVRVVVRDTIRITDPGTRKPNTPDGPIIMPRPPVDARVDTFLVVVHDTVTRVDTIRVRSGGVDTVRIPGRRVLFVPPGQYPPAGQCRVWIYDRPPGQQARPAACNALGTIPTGAFVLFNDQAWDADYDYAADPGSGSVPPEILAIRRRGGASRSARPR